MRIRVRKIIPKEQKQQRQRIDEISSGTLIQNMLNSAVLIQTTYDRLRNELEKLQNEVANYYHGLEITDFKHVSEGHNAALELQDMLRRRRIVKSELNRLSIILSEINMEEFLPKANKAMFKVREDYHKLTNYVGNSEEWNSYFKNPFKKKVVSSANVELIESKLKEYEISPLPDVDIDTVNSLVKEVAVAKEEVSVATEEIITHPLVQANAVMTDAPAGKDTVKALVFDRDKNCMVCGATGSDKDVLASISHKREKSLFNCFRVCKRCNSNQRKIKLYISKL